MEGRFPYPPHAGKAKERLGHGPPASIEDRKEEHRVSKAFEQLRRLAADYCHIIETVDEQDARWLQRIFHLLPQLHAAIAVLLEEGGRDGTHQEADLDARFELYTKLHRLLGERDPYWMEYDLGREECRSGSLADDLTDIYCELKQGLVRLEEERADPGHILGQWQRGYRLHWGRHLVDAERHLYDLSSRGIL